MGLKIFIVVIAILVSAALGSIAGYYLGNYLFGAMGTRTSNPVVEYYRGVYDVCRAGLHGTPRDCLLAIEKAKTNKWYESESVGWVWNDSPETESKR